MPNVHQNRKRNLWVIEDAYVIKKYPKDLLGRCFLCTTMQGKTKNEPVCRMVKRTFFVSGAAATEEVICPLASPDKTIYYSLKNRLSLSQNQELLPKTSKLCKVVSCIIISRSLQVWGRAVLGTAGAVCRHSVTTDWCQYQGSGGCAAQTS